jgi:hypothetical protein
LLYREGGAVKAAHPAAIGVPGELLTWPLRRASDWPRHVRVRLTISSASSEPLNATLSSGGETAILAGDAAGSR